MNGLIKKISQWIKQARLINTDDSTAYPRAQVSYNGKTSNIMRLSPYGLCSNPPNDSLVLLLNLQGQESVKVGIADDILNRFKNLAQGEAVLYNTQTQSYVLMRANGDVQISAQGNIDADATGNITADAGGNIEATAGGNIAATATGSATITAPAIVLNGNVTIAGTLAQTGGGAATFSGGLTANELTAGGVPYTGHVHGGVQTGGSNTGGPQ